MPLEITQREINGIYLLALRGRLVLGDESRGFRETVEILLSTGATKLVVNLEQVTHVDSAGLGALIEAHRNTKAKGARLKLSNLGPKFKQALELARLLPIFETYPTEARRFSRFLTTGKYPFGAKDRVHLVHRSTSFGFAATTKPDPR